MRAVELRAVGGRALVAGVPLAPEPAGRLWGLPADLVTDLQEWARVAGTAPSAGSGDAGHGVAVSRRGRHLAARLSVRLRVPVDYCDPVTGHCIALRGLTPSTQPGPVKAPPPRRPREPTPWATGLALAGLVAGLALLANLALALPLVAGLGPAGVLVDLAVAAGLAPALWLNRAVPTWRWAVFGTLGGMALAVPVLLVSALG